MPRLCLSHESSGRAYLALRGLSGVYPSEIADDGPEPSPLANDPDLPGDADTLILWLLQPSLPSSGTTLVTDDGGYGLIGADDGVHVQAYRLLWIESDGTTGVDDGVIYTLVGSGRLTVGVWDGSGWSSKLIKVWTGSAWEVKPLKHYDGAWN